MSVVLLAKRGPAVVLALALTACSATSDQTAPNTPTMSVTPDPLLTEITVGGAAVRLWPFASATLESPDDPINLVFAGESDPRAIRDALLGLDGNRGAPFPPVFPFDCVWSDAIGGLMGAFGEDGWAGGAVQLQCGDYGPLRFHLRLFDLGGITVGNAHFEVLIPGTADHQVLSWELAEQLATYDLARTGLLGAAPDATPAISPAPTHRVIPAPIYNGLPAAVQQLIGGPASPAPDVGIATDGRATIVTLAGRAPEARPTSDQTLSLGYNQVIPKPFCGGANDYVVVAGPVELRQEVRTLPSGELRSRFEATGKLQVTPIDPGTGTPLGETLEADAAETQLARAFASGALIEGRQTQTLGSPNAPGGGSLSIQLVVSPGGAGKYTRKARCN